MANNQQINLCDYELVVNDDGNVDCREGIVPLRSIIVSFSRFSIGEFTGGTSTKINQAKSPFARKLLLAFSLKKNSATLSSVSNIGTIGTFPNKMDAMSLNIDDIKKKTIRKRLELTGGGRWKESYLQSKWAAKQTQIRSNCKEVYPRWSQWLILRGTVVMPGCGCSNERERFRRGMAFWRKNQQQEFQGKSLPWWNGCVLLFGYASPYMRPMNRTIQNEMFTVSSTMSSLPTFGRDIRNWTHQTLSWNSDPFDCYGLHNSHPALPTMFHGTTTFHQDVK